MQTNETGRGIAWLFPVSAAGWPRVHLVELGASAGLNLVADKRSYRFLDARNSMTHFRLGEGKTDQFTIRSRYGFDRLPAAPRQPPRIISRTGYDINPIRLRTPLDEATLTAFVWADQVARLARLREGIAALDQVTNSDAPIELYAVDLPDGLPEFFETNISKDNDPLLCYNTFIRMYLPNRGRGLRSFLAKWAEWQNRLVVWIQWEPASSLNDRHGKAPEYGWLAWTIDLWHRGEAHHWQIGWIHPHGHQAHWLPGLQGWLETASKLSF